MAPYLATLLAFAMLAGILHADGIVSTAGVYGIGLVGIMIAGYGYDRWEDRRQSR